MINVEVDLTDGLSPVLAQLVESLSGEQAAELNQVGGRSANTAAIEYHQEFNQRGGWRGNRYVSGPGRRTGEFGQNVALGWNFKVADKDSATISNNADFYRFKVTGGTVRAKRASFLTIPLVSEAQGRRAADYVAATGNTLFQIRGKTALFADTGDGNVKAIYALKREVTQEPWKDAVPDDETLSSAFIEGWLGALGDKIESL